MLFTSSPAQGAGALSIDVRASHIRACVLRGALVHRRHPTEQRRSPNAAGPPGRTHPDRCVDRRAWRDAMRVTVCLPIQRSVGIRAGRPAGRIHAKATAADPRRDKAPGRRIAALVDEARCRRVLQEVAPANTHPVTEGSRRAASPIWWTLN
jgi:hypothetical protein